MLSCLRENVISWLIISFLLGGIVWLSVFALLEHSIETEYNSFYLFSNFVEKIPKNIS